MYLYVNIEIICTIIIKFNNKKESFKKKKTRRQTALLFVERHLKKHKHT